MSALGSSRNHYYLKAHLRRKRQTWAEQNHAREKKNLIFWENAFVVSGSCVPWRLKEQALQNLTDLDLNPDSIIN